MKKFGVIFVCTGNICRSPAAEGVFRQRAAERGLSEHFVIDSAGTHDYHAGHPPDPRTIASARARGISVDDLRARKLHYNDFNTFDLIVAMDSGHYEWIKAMAPAQSRAEIVRFRSFTADKGSDDVPDPYYGGPEDFEHVMTLVESGVEGLLDHLCSKAAT